MSKLQVVLNYNTPEQKEVFKKCFVKETWNDRDTGEERSAIKFKVDLIELSDEKKRDLFENENVKIVQSHFAVKPETKEEQEKRKLADEKPPYVGNGNSIIFPSQEPRESSVESDEIDDLPF